MDEGNSSDKKMHFSLENLIKHFLLEFYEMAVLISIDIGLPLGIQDRTWLKFLYLYGDKTLRGKCTFTMP